jgi:hypothetical protein
MNPSAPVPFPAVPGPEEYLKSFPPAHDFKSLELQRLKGEAQKIPPKIRVFSFIMLLCFLFTYLVIIALEIMKSLNGMF